MEYVITVDAGTTNFKAMLYSEEGSLHFSSIRHYWPVFMKNQQVRQDPETWKNALYETLSEISAFLEEKGIAPAALIIASQRASVIPLDSSGSPLYPAFMWQDKSTYAQSEKVKGIIDPREVYLETGLRIDPYFSAPKILWLRENEEEVYKSTSRFVGVQDYIVYLLTGKIVTDHTQASRTLLFDISGRKWSDKMMKAAGIGEKLLPDLIPPGSEAGTVTAGAAAVTGLKKGLPVLIAGGDQQAAAIGLGVFRKGRAEANTGTGSFILSHSDAPVFDREMRILCSISAAPEGWVAEAGMLTTGIIYKWFARVIAGNCAAAADPGSRDKNRNTGAETDVERKLSENIEEAEIDEINRLARTSDTGSGGVIILPHFKGCAAPYWDPFAKGVIFNLTLSNTRGDIAHAVLEAIALELADNISIIEENTGSLSQVSVAGGLTQLDLFNQIQSDTFSRPVIRYGNPEATSIGSLVLACSSLGIYSDIETAFKAVVAGKPEIYTPDRKNSDIYSRYGKLRKKLYSAISDNSLYTDIFSLQKEMEEKNDSKT